MRRFLPLLPMTLLALAATPIALGGDPGKVRFTHEEPFSDARLVTAVGTRYAEGCRITPPSLESSALGPRLLGIRQVELDYETCTGVYEIGIPAKPHVSEGGTSTERAAAVKPKASRQSARNASSRYLAKTAATRSGYYMIWFEDYVHIDVTKTRANLTWYYNGSCTSGGSASGYWWWRSGTGWNINWSNSYAWLTGGGCGVSYYAHANGEFWNNAFCGYTVWTFALDVRFRGGYAGGYGGSVGDAWHSTSCAPLHYHGELWAS